MSYASTAIPYISYRDATRAIELLTAAFGFEVVTTVPGEDGAVMHAELSYGGGHIMLGTDGSAGDDGTPTRGVYFVVSDVDAHHARASSAGIEVTESPADTPFGTRRWRGRDHEGNEWTFGTYAPGGSW